MCNLSELHLIGMCGIMEAHLHWTKRTGAEAPG
jgi:hypothetical protein